MRTTVDLPTELLRGAKARAAERGETLKELFARAVARELGGPTHGGRGRVSLPLVGSGPPAVNITNSDIEAALTADDADRTRGR